MSVRLSPLYPPTVPEVITSLMSIDKKAADQAEKTLQQLLGDAQKGSADFDYLSNVIQVIRGKVADIQGQQAKLKQKADDFEAINEEGVIAAGAVVSAVATAPNLTSLTVASASVAAGIKLVFSGIKWWYNGHQSKQIRTYTERAMHHAIDECATIFKNVYKQPLPEAEIKSAKAFSSQKALMFAQSII